MTKSSTRFISEPRPIKGFVCARKSFLMAGIRLLAAPAILGVTLSSVAGGQAFAQEALEVPTERPDAQTYVCLRNSVREGDSDAQPLGIAVAPDKVAEFSKRGFIPAACRGAKFATAEGKADVCGLARARDPAMTDFF